VTAGWARVRVGCPAVVRTFELRRAAIPNPTSVRSFGPRGSAVATALICATLGSLATGCSGGSTRAASHGVADGVRLSITPAGGGIDAAPSRGITVRAAGGRISKVIVRTAGDRVTGALNAAGTVWRSAWALNVSQR